MFTVCSKCNLRLTVTATDLRAAQGYVRCGRCQNVFNALAALADDPRSAASTPAADTQTRRTLTAPTSPGPEPDGQPEGATATDASLEFNPASTNINEVFIEASREPATGSFESIMLEEAAPAPAKAPAEALTSQPAAPASTSEEAAFMSLWADAPASAEQFTVNEAAATEIATALQAAEPVHPEPVQVESVAPEAVQPEPVILPELDADSPGVDFLRGKPATVTASRWPAYVLASALSLCLVAQLLHHYRGALADTSVLHRPLTALYAGLGLPLGRRWDIANYEIRQLGASTDGSADGDLMVRASISNRDAREQPLPLLRVVMQDRFGNRVAGRDLNPVEYLGPALPPGGVLTPGQRVDVQVAFRDPGQAATGFELDVCMVGDDRTVTCANDAGSH